MSLLDTVRASRIADPATLWLNEIAALDEAEVIGKTFRRAKPSERRALVESEWWQSLPEGFRYFIVYKARLSYPLTRRALGL